MNRIPFAVQDSQIGSTPSHQPQEAQDKRMKLLNGRCWSCTVHIRYSRQIQGSERPCSSFILQPKLSTNPSGEGGLFPRNMVQHYSLKWFTFSHTVFQPLLRAGHRLGRLSSLKKQPSNSAQASSPQIRNWIGEKCFLDCLADSLSTSKLTCVSWGEDGF